MSWLMAARTLSRRAIGLRPRDAAERNLRALDILGMLLCVCVFLLRVQYAVQSGYSVA